MTEPTNETRAERARAALDLHGGPHEDFRTKLIDLLADLHHLAVEELDLGEDAQTAIEDALAIAQDHFDEERRDELHRQRKDGGRC